MDSMAVSFPKTPGSGPEEPENENEGWYCLEYVLAGIHELGIVMTRFGPL